MRNYILFAMHKALTNKDNGISNSHARKWLGYFRYIYKGPFFYRLYVGDLDGIQDDSSLQGFYESVTAEVT